MFEKRRKQSNYSLSMRDNGGDSSFFPTFALSFIGKTHIHD